MPAAASWKCVYCGTVYSEEESAVDCEKTHNKFCHQDFFYRKGERNPYKVVVTLLGDEDFAYPKEVTYVRE